MIARGNSCMIERGESLYDRKRKKVVGYLEEKVV